MELNLLNARTDMTDCESSLKSNMFQLRSFLDYDENVDIEPEIPLDVPEVEIGFDDALVKASRQQSLRQADGSPSARG